MEPEPQQDVFISHASADKKEYIHPLADAFSANGVAYWLDDAEIKWGDSIAGKINEGLRSSQFALVCLSNNFLQRAWPESEMSAVLAIQNSAGVKRVLPLILNSKDEVLRQYPLLAGLAYREFRHGPGQLANEIKSLTEGGDGKGDHISITVEGVHTGKLCHVRAPHRASVTWLAKKAQSGLDVREGLRAGPFTEFHVRWVLVDVDAEDEWLNMARWRQREIYAVVMSEAGVVIAESGRDRLESLRVRDGSVFHLYAIEDEEHYPPPAAEAPPPGDW